MKIITVIINRAAQAVRFLYRTLLKDYKDIFNNESHEGG